MPAAYSYVTLRIEDWSIREQTGRDRKKYRVEGSVDGSGATQPVVGIAAHDAVASGNPVSTSAAIAHSIDITGFVEAA